MAAQEMYQKTLDKNCVSLGINLNFNDIKNHLIAKELISREKANQIEGMDGNEKRVNAFIDHLYQSDLRKTFKIFTEILKKEDKQFLVDDLYNSYQSLMPHDGDDFPIDKNALKSVHGKYFIS